MPVPDRSNAKGNLIITVQVLIRTFAPKGTTVYRVVSGLVLTTGLKAISPSSLEAPDFHPQHPNYLLKS
jgi:hypothetical protein